MPKQRLDEYLFRTGAAADARDALVVVTEGRVFVNGQKAVAPGQFISETDAVEVRQPRQYVGRGAYKLATALKEFHIDVAGAVCADIGAATGGFTEVLLKAGAKKVYAIDAGRGKLDLKLREDPRVVVMEETNVLALGDAFGKRLPAPARPAALATAPRSSRRGRDTVPGDGAFASGEAPRVWTRHLERSQKHLSSAGGREEIDVVTIDVSFTSLRAVLPIVRSWLSEKGSVIVLFKPQYEVKDKSQLRHGIVEDAGVREEAIQDFRAWLGEHGWQEQGFMESPIRGSEGNVEYLFYLMP